MKALSPHHLAALDQGRRGAAQARERSILATFQAQEALRQAAKGCPRPVRWRCYTAPASPVRVDVPHGAARRATWAWAYEGGRWVRVPRRWAARLLAEVRREKKRTG